MELQYSRSRFIGLAFALLAMFAASGIATAYVTPDNTTIEVTE